MEAPITEMPEEGWCPVGTPGIVAMAVMLATFMEVLDSTECISATHRRQHGGER